MLRRGRRGSLAFRSLSPEQLEPFEPSLSQPSAASGSPALLQAVQPSFNQPSASPASFSPGQAGKSARLRRPPQLAAISSALMPSHLARSLRPWLTASSLGPLADSSRPQPSPALSSLPHAALTFSPESASGCLMPPNLREKRPRIQLAENPASDNNAAPASAKVTVTIDADHLECSICNKYKRNAVFWACGAHSFCSMCAHTYLYKGSGNLECPECRREFGGSDHPLIHRETDLPNLEHKWRPDYITRK